MKYSTIAVPVDLKKRLQTIAGNRPIYHLFAELHDIPLPAVTPTQKMQVKYTELQQFMIEMLGHITNIETELETIGRKSFESMFAQQKQILSLVALVSLTISGVEQVSNSPGFEDSIREQAKSFTNELLTAWKSSSNIPEEFDIPLEGEKPIK